MPSSPCTDAAVVVRYAYDAQGQRIPKETTSAILNRMGRPHTIAVA